jgi:hypothetical protein
MLHVSPMQSRTHPSNSQSMITFRCMPMASVVKEAPGNTLIPSQDANFLNSLFQRVAFQCTESPSHAGFI